jgi:regulator of CtrA degradation
LRDYINHGDRLFDRVQQFDKLERGNIAETAPLAIEGSIGDQLSRLRAAFGKLQG